MVVAQMCKDVLIMYNWNDVFLSQEEIDKPIDNNISADN